MTIKTIDQNCDPSGDGILLVITGPSGVGKDTVISEFLKRNNDFHKLVTDTNRPPREKEIPGKDYNFFTLEQFLERIGQGIYLEYAEVRPKEYKGTPKKAVEQLLEGKNIILKTDEYAGAHMKDIFRKGLPQSEVERIIAKTVTLYIAPEDWSQLREQYFKRESKANQDWFMVKLQRDKEMWEKYHDRFDYVVVNRRGRIGETVTEVENIAAARGKSCKRIPGKVWE